MTDNEFKALLYAYFGESDNYKASVMLTKIETEYARRGTNFYIWNLP